MHIGKSYKIHELLHWTRRRGYVLLILTLAPVLAWQFGLRPVSVPWPVAALLGTAASFIVGFKNVQTYNRSMDAQQVWMSIAATSRYWALLCRDFPRTQEHLETLVRRHLAWLTSLRYFAREPRPWESATRASNAEYRKRNFGIPEQQISLDAELRGHLSDDESSALQAVQNKAGWLLARQSAAIGQMYQAQDLVVLHHTEMQKTLKDLLEQQGRVERIKNFPYPRQYAVINTVFVWCFVAVLPLCLVREFAIGWLAIPFALLIGWLYLTLDQIGESTENPFEGSANDVPVSHICRNVENELLAMLQEEPRPALQAPGSTILL